MLSNENNVAAQAGDEPMRAVPVKRTANGFVVHHRLETLVREYGTLDLRSQRRRDCMAEIYEIAAAQVSPRATADVERNLRAELINEGALRQYCHNDGSAGFVTAYDFDITNRFLAAIATVKPGA